MTEDDLENNRKRVRLVTVYGFDILYYLPKLRLARRVEHAGIGLKLSGVKVISDLCYRLRSCGNTGSIRGHSKKDNRCIFKIAAGNEG